MAMRPAPVTGSDGHAPQYDPDSRWTIWNREEIYMGDTALHKYVPKVNDWVQDINTGEVFVVRSVDAYTLIPDLGLTTGNSADPSDLLVTNSADTYRVYLDDSVVPHILAVDTRFKVGGTQSQYAKIYKAGNAVDSGTLVSFLYDTDGNYLTDQIPLELCAIDSHSNHAIKTVTVCHTNQKMKDGERVMVVIYNDQGHVVDKKGMLIENTSFIRSIDAGTLYLSHITLDSPFINESNPNELDYPINVPLQAFNMFCILHYSNGDKKKVPIDGTKASVHGLENFVSTVVGQNIKLVLSYKLDKNEVCYGAVSADGKYVTQPYTLITTTQDGAYTVKVFGYPVWVDANNGYKMQYWMMDLNRDILYDVTPYIHYNANGDTFDGKAYGTLQQLSIRLNLKDVSKGLKSYIHTQTLQVSLKNEGDSPDTRWLVATEPTQQPFYGEGVDATVYMINHNYWRLNIRSGFGNYQDWLQALYYNSKPLLDLRSEVTPPEPTHFRIIYKNTKQEFSVADWSKTLQVSGDYKEGSTVFIEFLRKTSQGTQELTISGLTVKAQQ